jgi:hypothetical protein
MATTSLSTILRNKYNDTTSSSNQVYPAEENLEKGRIWLFSDGNMYGKFIGCVCWVAPGTGTAVVEIWGAGGSSAQISCCGWGLPGNSGAYSKKTVAVTSSTVIRGCQGFSCGNANTICYRGRSEPTMVCICCIGGAAVTACMCAEGGFGGTSQCQSYGTANPYCCAIAAGFCYTNHGSGCGVICNYSTTSISAVGSAVSRAQAYGGDTNCQGMFGCAIYSACCMYAPCQYGATIPVPPGYISSAGANITIQYEDDNGQGTYNGAGLNQFLIGLNAAGKQPMTGGFKGHCWCQAHRTCGCYEQNGCGNWLPIGTGGLLVTPCAGVCDTASRGGQGAIRIRFYS